MNDEEQEQEEAEEAERKLKIMEMEGLFVGLEGDCMNKL